MKDSRKPSENTSPGETFNPILDRWRNRPAARKPGITRTKRFRIIILANIVLLVLMVAITYRQDQSASSYSSLVLASDGFECRFSIGYNKNTGNPILSMTVKNTTKGDLSLPVERGLAVIEIRGSADIIARKKFSVEGKRLVLGPGESKTFIETIDHGILDEADAPVDHARGIFKLIPSRARVFTADCSILPPAAGRTGSMTFTHEVRR